MLLFSKFTKKEVINEKKINTNNLSFKHEKIDIFHNKQDETSSKNKSYIRQQPKIGRNEPCFCKSGKKYKQCHGKS